MPGEYVLWRDVADSAVQAHVVVMLYVTLHQTKRIFERQRRPGPNALPFEGFVPTFDFAIRLRVIRRSPDVRHARDANELLEVLSDELRPVVGNDSRFNARILLFGTFQNDLNVGFRHRLPQIPMNQETAVAVQDAAQVVERRANVQVGNIDMPMLVRLRLLFKTRPFLRGLAVPLPQQPRPIQHPPHAGRTHRHDVGVQHHERQPPIAFQWILQVERNDRLLLPILQPKVSGNPTIMLEELAVPPAPAVELAGSDVEPADEPPGADLGLLRPAPDEIHDLVPRIVRNPDPGQSSPTLFFRATCSAISSAKKKSWGTLTRVWVPHDTRDEIVDFVRRWSEKTEISAGRFIRWLDITASKFYGWRERYGRVNEHNGWIPRDFWLEDWEKQAIIAFHLKNPLEGYRRLAFMMLDADIVAVSPASVWRVLNRAGLLRKWNGKPSKKGTGFEQPPQPHQHWHIDVSYLNVLRDVLLPL